MSTLRHQEPRIGVFCRCGAQWSGRWVEKAADTIAGHRRRCGVLIPVQTYELLGHTVRWPKHWTEEERQTARSASLQEAARVE